MSKSILYIEDNNTLREETSEFLTHKGWDVVSLPDYETGMKLLNDKAYDVILLDYQIDSTKENPAPMQGDQFLELAANRGVKLPPILVFSGHLNPELVEWFHYLGVNHIIEKPFRLPDLVNVLIMLARGAAIRPLYPQYSLESISRMVKTRETAIKEYTVKKIAKDYNKIRFKEPLFIVARRWNSWYPTLFSVQGGTYAVVSPPSSQKTDMYHKGETPAFAIDPGFKFMESLDSIGLSIKNVHSCIITHNHPDHIGGFFEYMAARNASRETVRALCNHSATEMFRNLAGTGMNIQEITEQYTDIIGRYAANGIDLKIRCKSFCVDHNEIGVASKSVGLVINIKATDNREDEKISDIVILGDTEYNHTDHYNRWMPILCSHTTKLVILHIGSAQIKEATGKHLYLNGTDAILRAMDIELERIQYRGKLLVLISEWGLEHATNVQLKNICGEILPDFNDVSPIEETIKTLGCHLNKIILLPADVGLTIGMLSGKVYMDNNALPPEDVAFHADAYGIEYSSN